MERVLILGAGGHAKVVADILLQQGVSVLGFLDDNRERWNSTMLGLPVLGGIDRYCDHHPGGLLLGIGENSVRQTLVNRLGEAASTLWVNAIHPRSTIAPSVALGRGIVVAAGVVVNPDTIIGDHVILNSSATVDHDCAVGDYSHLAPGVHLAGGVRIEEGTLLGIGSVVTPYCSVGRWSVVGAGAVVVRDIPSQVVAKGVPAHWQ